MSCRSRLRTQQSISAPSFPPASVSRLPSTPSQYPGQRRPSSTIDLHPRTSAESVPQTATSVASFTCNLHTLPTSNILLLPTLRPGRRQWSTPLDPNPNTSYGDNIREKPTNSLRIFFQNVKGLSHSDGFEDYKYYLSSLHAFGVDISGLAETNTAWQHAHLQQDIRKIAHRQFRQSKLMFGSPTPEIDKCSPLEAFQSGGVMSLVQGTITSSINGDVLKDDTGLGRWTGVTLRGHGDYKLSIITAYRTCGGNIKTSSIGSVFSREYLYFRSCGFPSPNPRRFFFQHLCTEIQRLQEMGHHILVMLDANSDLSTDHGFSDFVSQCELHDLHNKHAPPSTYIGSPHRRIDYILGCGHLVEFCTRSGSLSYFEGPQSDHRGLFVDLQIPALFSALRVQKLSPASHRVLHTGNPELVSAYLQSVGEYYSSHRMKERIDDLFSKHKTMEKAEVLRLLTGWDNDQGRAMSYAETKLSKPPKKCAWSPTLRNIAMIRKYWKLRLREKKYHLCYFSTFLRWQYKIQKCDSTFAFPFLEIPLSIEEIRKHFNAATKLFRKSQLDSTSLRLKTYEELIKTYLEDSNPTTREESERRAKVLLKTIQTETCRKTFGDLRNVFKPSSMSALSKILIPRHESVTSETSVQTNLHALIRDTKPEELRWDTIIDREEIEQHLLSYNREAFRAAAESPCGHGLIYNSITFTSLSQSAKELLEGTVPPEWYGDDQVLKEFLASFTIPDSVIDSEPISTTISEDDVVRGFKGWRETTTTSPSGRHLGHYKALITDPILLQCLTKFLNIALFHGIALPRWCNATNILLEKDPGRPTINRLRIIHLFEADFNFLLKILWGSRLVQRAVTLELLHDGQFGSVPRKTTMDPIMLTQLTTDLSRILKMNMARFDNDASACYDRIIVAFGMLAARRCGMPENAISTHSSALKFMRYAVKTIYGVSKDTYMGTDTEPLFGTGQGSGASPSVWLSLVVLLLKTLEKLIPDRIAFESPTRIMQHSRLVDAYVDDTSLGLTDPSDEYTLEELVDRLQSIAQTWEKILSISGGALNFKKCSWYAVYWDWENGRPRLRPISSDDPNITLSNSFGTPCPQQIPRMPIEASSRILGVHLSPSGQFSDAIKVYKSKADKFAAMLKSPRIRATEARIFHRSIYVPTMRYGLAALSASEEELMGVQSRLLASLLQKMNVSCSIPTSIRHGPLELGGMALYDLRTELGIETVKFLRDAIFSNSSAGRLILLNLQYSQLEAGIGESLLEHPTIPVPYLTPSWILSVREFISKHNMSITLTEQPTITKATPSDQFIMQTGHLQRYSVGQQRDINLVRIYLQVSTLADMTDTTQPNRILGSYLDGIRPSPWTETMRWPRQAAPSLSQRRLWKRYLVSSFLRYAPYWKQNPTLKSSGSHSVFFESSAPPHIPDAGIKMSLMEYLKILPRTQRRMVTDVQQVATDVQIWRAFRSRERLHIASDGGLSGHDGTFGWVLATTKQVLFKCGGPVDGPFDTASSTRSELCGFASSLLLIAAVARNWGLRHRCSFRWLTDSRSAISKVYKTNRRGCTASRQPFESDLLSMIRSLLIEIRRVVIFKWVKGHQDSLMSYEKLPRAARLNIDADFLATRYRLRGKLKSTRHTDHCPEQRVSISILGVRLTSQYDECIRYHINGYHLKQYMQDRKQWNEATWNMIDTGLFGQHFKRLTSSQQITHMKVVHDQLPLGIRRYQRSQSKEETLKVCPCCTKADETSQHLWRCKENSFMEPGLLALRRPGKGGPHPLLTILIGGIMHWIDTGASDFRTDVGEYPVHMRETLARIIGEQEHIGWENALKGFLSKSWLDLASMQYEDERYDKTAGLHRLQQCIKALYTYTEGIWRTRNSALHDSENQFHQRLRSNMHDTIIHLHNNPEKICFDDQYLCEMSLQTLLQSSSATQRRWIKRMRDSREMHTRMGERQTLITSYFRRDK